MKKTAAALGAAFLLLAVILFAPIRKVGAQSGYTTLWSQWIQSSLIDSTPIGQTTPAAGSFTSLNANAMNSTSVGLTTPEAGNFTSLNATTFTLGHAAPAGHYLVGNGTSYVDTPLPSQITQGLQVTAISSCVTPSGGELTQTCGPYSWTNAFADANYAAGCNYVGTVSGTGSHPGLYGPYLINKTASTFSVVIQAGSSSAAGANSIPEVDCWGIHP